MMPARAVAPILCSLAAGCVPAVRTDVVAARPDPAAREMIALAASRIQRCYQAPRVPHEARQIETVLAVSYAPDGSLATLPELIAQRGVSDANRAEAPRMAEAARLAVIRCAPLRLPPEHYQDGWDMFQLTFSPKAVA